MKQKNRFRSFIRLLSSFFVFFLLVSFVITCCLMLFISLLQESMGYIFTQEELTAAAKATMLNILFISLCLTIIDRLRRIWMIERPAAQITAAAERIVAGDFQFRIPKTAKFATDDVFYEIITCLNDMTRELAGVETLRSDFIANVSHEMKTPLSVIQNYTTLLSAPHLPKEERLEYARAAGEAARRLSDMITNVLKLNRLENQQIYPSPTRFDLGEQLCACLLPYEGVWEEKHIRIETELTDGVLLWADAELLSLVWSNLFSNAFKFTEAGGCVRLALHTDGPYAIVRVSDTGCGMSPAVGAHIFEKFYQGDSSHATQGNGLGLALAKRVIDILQGEIRVESRVGVGTTFSVKLRRADDEA